MGNKEAAKGVYVGLVERNSDNEEYLKGYLRSLSLWKDEAEASPEPGMVQALRDLLEKYPRSNTIQKWILQVTFGEKFSKEAEKYLREQIDKGIPSLFKNLKGIIMDKNKDETQKGKKLREIVESINKSLLETGKYPGITEQANEKARQWSEYFLAQYYDYLGMHKESLDIIEKTEADQDDKAEWQVLKAKVLKHQGDLVGAKDAMNVARVDQKADRFLNTKTVKYLLRCGDVKEAEKTIQLFIRDDAVHKKQELVDMQVVWYFLEKARAFRNKHKFPRALVHYNQVIAAHNEFYDDQLDFHAYCLRKSTLKPYLNLLSWEDSMYDSSKSYIEAVGGFLGGLVYLHDRCFKAKHITTSNTPAVTPTTTTTTTSSSSSSSVPASEDEVALSLPYAKSSSPLDFAAPILSTISKLNLKTPKLWLSSFAVYFRTGKYSDALQCLFNAASSSNLFDSDSRDYFAVFASLFALSLVLDLSDAQYSAQLDKILSTLNANKLSATFAKTDFTACYPAPADAQKLDRLLDFLTSSPLSSSISTSTGLQLNYYSAVLDSLKALTSSSSPSLVPVHLDSLYSRILSVFSKNIIPLLSSQNSTSRLELSDILSIKDSLYLAIELCKLDTKHINTSKDNNKKVLENLNVVLADLQALYTSFISKATELFPRATTLTSN
ncbi:N-terminal acetyltransferase A complex subunit nat1 [Zancudomyces culisetae]|uniref:N-terminal acetyltransferase A complex subunit nat1 n=1 Tax=Zancudomyces culisetae TaxID=1213189 RepID=A0A1R1PLB9_ZANCU|nr:N-terminal acetyltransferase A complex subunit nat1 [Zancudomyces culisetae]OMH81755.1 N-terminal acetyltransferase A complex subunit nat1 [Zancudomyces culisetae]|eukprot:OMH79539.1 N-terminal acetyltransferase A complex subunit nat1 [Zancudomyces culisetae]